MEIEIDGEEVEIVVWGVGEVERRVDVDGVYIVDVGGFLG